MEIAIIEDEKELDRLEGIIRTNLRSFYEVGSALMQIRDKGLYSIKHGGQYRTFEDYCKGGWDFTARHAERLMLSAGVVENTRPMGRIPENERQAREVRHTKYSLTTVLLCITIRPNGTETMQATRLPGTYQGRILREA